MVKIFEKGVKYLTFFKSIFLFYKIINQKLFIIIYIKQKENSIKHTKEKYNLLFIMISDSYIHVSNVKRPTIIVILAPIIEITPSLYGYFFIFSILSLFINYSPYTSLSCHFPNNTQTSIPSFFVFNFSRIRSNFFSLITI